jgi:hypothetical protein
MGPAILSLTALLVLTPLVAEGMNVAIGRASMIILPAGASTAMTFAAERDIARRLVN